MKQTLRILIAIILLVALLGQNISVFAIASMDVIEAVKESTETNEVNQKDETAMTTPSSSEETSDVEEAKPEQDLATSTEDQSSLEEKTKSEETTSPEIDQEGEEKAKDSEEVYEEEKSNGESTIVEAEEEETESEEPIVEEEKGKGKIWIEINLRLPQINPKLTIKVKKGNATVDTITSPKSSIKKELAGKEGNEASTEFYTNLYYISKELNSTTEDSEKYSIEITGSNYLTYVQNNIPIKSGNETKIRLTNGYDATYLIKNKVGVTFIGDVDSDGTVSDKDVNQITSLIESGKYESKCDLNGDGKVNIVDLSYVAINRNKTDKPKGATTHKLMMDDANSEVTTGSVIEGAKTEDILEDNGKVVEFAPAKPELAIAPENPVVISLDLGENNKTETEVITIAPSTKRENNITKGVITVQDAEDNTYEANLETGEVSLIKNSSEVAKVRTYARIATSRNAVTRIASETTSGKVTIDPDGTIVLDIGKKVAIKKVTIKVTGTEGSSKLADISKVEFLNDMEDKIPAPSMDIPENVKGEATSEELIVSWDSVSNVTSYEVSVESRGMIEHHSVAGHSIVIKFFNGKEIKDQLNEDYTIKVQSVNGEWRSGYSEPITLRPTLRSKPEAPDNLILTGKFRLIEATWKDMKNKGTDTYNVYYKKDGETTFTKVAEGLTANSYKIENLSEESIRYQVYVTGVNAYGESEPSIVNTVETISVQPVEFPKYKLLNTSNGTGKLTNHIKSATYLSGKMEGSPLDKGNSALGLFDDDFASFWRKDDWDDGVSYGSYQDRGISIEFDQAYDINYFTMAQVQNLDMVRAVNVTYWDDQNKAHTVSASFVVTRKDKNGRDYTTVKLTDKINAKKIHINISRIYGHTRDLTIAEMCFYQYDDIEEKIDNLYEGQLHVTLKDGVTSEEIDELENRLNTTDEVSGELHPEYVSLKAELDTAREILANKDRFQKQVEIDTSVTSAKDGNISFKSGINAWQPLGLVGYTGEELTIYVGNRAKNIGDSSSLKLIATQYNAEAAAWQKVVTNQLKIGKNTVTIPSIATFDCETGGSLYIEYTGKDATEEYAVRVIGGQEIPVLDLTKKGINRENAVKEYIQKLEEIVPKLEETHKKVHENQKDKKGNLIKATNYKYDEKTCLLGATEIVLEDMMYSVPAKQILEGLEGNSVEEKAEKLNQSLTAMEDMIELFYSHKGMSREIEEGKPNSFPSGRQNIRYHRMFVGAAMYAGGLHIGIPWGDVQTLSKGNPITTDANGKYQSGNYFGWGISHEIGHIINDSHYVHGEVTNNYFSVLSQAEETNSSVRFQYPEVYKKVTSGKIGKSDNVFTQLGLYWQLHLAFDKGYNFKVYESQKEQLDNLLFARIDTYARAADSKTGIVDENVAPKPTTDNGVKLTVDSDTDNNLMRLACAATKSNLLAFFERWGFVPNEETIKYAKQWNPNEKAIYYMTDETRAYQLENGAPMTSGTQVIADINYQVNVQNKETSNEVKISLATTETNHKESILGYEIVRSYMDNDKEISKAVAFVSAEDIYGGSEKAKNYGIEYQDGKIVYTDRIDTLNNRVLTYTVIAYDKYLNKTEAKALEPIKIRSDGSIAKEGWEITSNLVENTHYLEGDHKTTCEPEKATEISKIANNNKEDEYVAQLPTDENGEIIISLDEPQTITGLKYKAGSKNPIQNYEIQVSNDKTNWEAVKEGTFQLDESKEQKVYFNKEGDDRYYTYKASYVKFIIKDQTNISIAEIDLLGESGDNVELIEEGVGLLKERYILQKEDEDHEEVAIPANSIIFTGEYKGNPAYNVVKLWSQDNKLIGGNQVFFAENPVNGELGNVADGIWLYWIEPTEENYETVKSSLKSIRAELYRVDDALTNAGERLVSDTARLTLPTDWTNRQIVINSAN